MKKIILLIVVLCAVFVVVERQKLFMRDPLGSVVRNGQKEAGTQVYINFNNDVLVENDNAPMYVEVIEHGQPVGLPKETGCVHWVMCLLDNYPATLLDTSSKSTVESMDSKTVKLNDGDRGETVITLH
jgi:hypothetical protein